MSMMATSALRFLGRIRVHIRIVSLSEAGIDRVAGEEKLLARDWGLWWIGGLGPLEPSWQTARNERAFNIVWTSAIVEHFCQRSGAVAGALPHCQYIFPESRACGKSVKRLVNTPSSQLDHPFSIFHSPIRRSFVCTNLKGQLHSGVDASPPA